MTNLIMQTVIGTDLEQAVRHLREGEVVAIPTETVYGLAGNALNEDAVLKIFEAKQRPRFNPLIIHVSDKTHIDRYAREVPDTCRLLADRFSPGPLTFLLPKQSLVPDLVTSGSDLVAIRIPAHPLTQQLLRQLDFPLAAPSANPFGYVSPVTAAHVFDGLQGRIPYILDGGPCAMGLESTIIGFESGKVILHRHGAVPVEAIEAAIGEKVEMRTPVDRIDAPGQLKSHYAPHIPLWVGDVDSLMQVHHGKRIAVIAFHKKYIYPEPAYQYTLSPTGDLHEAARNLFRLLREVDSLDADIILAERFPEAGLGRAINDRLQRAQAQMKNDK
jgi:L-threonylcarbamoyladenylate synthase